MRTLKIQKNEEESKNVKALGKWAIASPSARFAAQCIDHGLVVFACVSALALWFPQVTWTPRWWATLVLLWAFVSWLSQVIFFAIYKNTPGKKILGLSIESARPNHVLTFTQIMTRAFTWWLGVASFGAGWVTILTRSDRKAWHDFAADTLVIHGRSESAYATANQKKIGDLWLTFLAVSFNIALGIALIFQIGKLTDSNIAKSDNPKALKGLLEKSARLPNSTDEVRFLESETKRYSPEQATYYEIRMAIAKSLMKSSDFNSARDLLENDVEIIEQTPPPDKARTSARALTDLYCEVKAFSGCSVERTEICSDSAFWKDWTSGCNLLTQPKKFVNVPQSLGFWWNKYSKTKTKFQSLDAWDQIQAQFRTQNLSFFENEVYLALNFATTAKSEDPRDIMEKARAVLPTNPLWGWAQQQALKEFGSQWAAIAPPIHHEMIARYQIQPSKRSIRAIASERDSKKANRLSTFDKR